MTSHDNSQDPDPEQKAEELERESKREGRRVEEAEEAPFTARRERMHEKEDPEVEREGKKTSSDYV
ncbi:hypothetical protein [Streptomyces montanisoli]|uniref:Uncharacterized protein n=1 Tax=Streptomyces montanisoli TaxID=2798581 RepID=A0A940MEN5_9ACTN|nr:hypothetical protein [Streptomyces montanisoli]MBP0459859.1 hypothetical protein [Streptomyces montanisoli]